MKIFVLGGKGLIGSAIVSKLKRNNYYKVYAITKNNYKNYKNQKCNIFINANGNSSRYYANKNPDYDFNLSVKTTYKSFIDFRFDHYIFLSSIDVYDSSAKSNSKKETKTIDVKFVDHYGLNKFLSENIVKHFSNSFLILRIGSVIDKKINKNHLFDMINKNKVYVNPKTKASFISVDKVTNILRLLINKKKFNHIYNIAGSTAISYQKIDKIFDINSNFDLSKKTFNYKVNTIKIEKMYKGMLNSEKILKDFKKKIKS